MRNTAKTALLPFLVVGAGLVVSAAPAISEATETHAASGHATAHFIQIARGELKCYRRCRNSIANEGGTIEEKRNFCANQCGLKEYL